MEPGHRIWGVDHAAEQKDARGDREVFEIDAVFDVEEINHAVAAEHDDIDKPHGQGDTKNKKRDDAEFAFWIAVIQLGDDARVDPLGH